MIDEVIARAVPSMVADADVRREFEQCTRANVDALLALLADPSLPVDGSVPAPAVRLVGTLVRRGADPQDLIEAYRVGQNEFWRWWMARLATRVEPGPALADALDVSSGVVFSRVDFLVGALLQEWERQHARWNGGALARRGEIVHRLLSDDPPALADASRTLDYDLDRVITAVLLWDATPDASEVRPCLDAMAAELAVTAGAERALTLPVGSGSLWAWIGTAGAPDMAALEAAAADRTAEGIGAAFGRSSARGFRRSHEEALAARRVADLRTDAASVVTYADVEVLSLITADIDRLGPFVRRAIGGLGGDGEVPTRLRETVAAWLAEGRNARRAAERLGLHKNTVLYRLQRAELLRGRPLTEDRLGLELALTVLEALGTHALRETPEIVRADGRSGA